MTGASSGPSQVPKTPRSWSNPIDAFWNLTARPGREIAAHSPQALVRCLRGFYATALVVLVHAVQRLKPFKRDATETPLWPVAWIDALPSATAVWLLATIAFLGVAAALLWPRPRATRIVAAAGIFLFLALCLSPTGVQHKWYPLILSAIFLSLFPSRDLPPHGRGDSAEASVWGAFLFLMTSYSVAGAQKILGILEALSIGDLRSLDPTQVPLALYRRSFALHQETPLAAWILDHPVLASLGFYTVIYTELFAIVAAFRPALSRLWPALLIVFHLSSKATMDILFLPSLLVLLFWTVFMPFGRRAVLSSTLGEMPLFGPFLRRLRPLPAPHDA